MYVLHCTVLYVAVVQMYCMLLLLFSRWVISDSMRHHRLQHAKLLFPLLPPGICSDSHRLSQWCHPNISSSVIPFSSCPQSFPVSGSLPKSWLSVMSGWPSGLRHQTQDSIFQRAGSLHQVAKVLELQRQSFQWTLRADFFKDLLVWSSCCPRDSQESSLAPQFENINSLALILLSIFISSPGCPEANVKAAVT